jgi:hypothetical protein
VINLPQVKGNQINYEAIFCITCAYIVYLVQNTAQVDSEADFYNPDSGYAVLQSCSSQEAASFFLAAAGAASCIDFEVLHYTVLTQRIGVRIGNV